MKYEDLYEEFKFCNPEGIKFYEEKEVINFIDESDGPHVTFGMVIVPYILACVQKNNIRIVQKIFSFLEDMAMCEDVKINEVLDFTILEQIADQGHNILDQCKQYMGENTLQHCEKVEKYFL